IPMALSGDISRNKNRLRKDTYDTDYISGLSTINFEKIAKEKVFSAINSVSLDSMSEIRKEFQLLSNRLGRVPYLADFQEQQTVDPLILANKKKNYYELLVSLKKNEGTLSESENTYLLILSRELLSGMRRHELLLLSHLLMNPNQFMSLSEMQELFTEHQLLTDDKTMASVLLTLTMEFYRGTQKRLYGKHPFIHVEKEAVTLAKEFKIALENDYFTHLLKDALKAARLKSEDYDTQAPLTRYKKYKR